jgi:hypothetical protein
MSNPSGPEGYEGLYDGPEPEEEEGPPVPEALRRAPVPAEYVDYYDPPGEGDSA